MKSYKFKFYEHRSNRYLKRKVNVAASIWNHCIALHKRYYSMFNKHLNKFRLMKHIAKLRRKNSYWQLLGSQCLQDVCDRIERGYQLFFKHFQTGTRPPIFRKVKKYKSFTFKQAGYKLLDSNRIRIGKRIYKFHKSREIKGKVKTVTIKRSNAGKMYLIIATDTVIESIGVVTNKSAGFDFGLKTFLTDSRGNEYKSPLFMLEASKLIRAASRNLSSKQEGSRNWNKARIKLAKIHETIEHKRRDWFWKLAHWLCDEYDYLFFETLNLKGMKRLWGRKVSDLAFATFIKILSSVANQKGKYVGFVDRWFPSTKTCSQCNHIKERIKLEDRLWRCDSCLRVNSRDSNAAVNIEREGSSSLGLGDVRRSSTAIAV